MFNINVTSAGPISLTSLVKGLV